MVDFFFISLLASDIHVFIVLGDDVFQYMGCEVWRLSPDTLSRLRPGLCLVPRPTYSRGKNSMGLGIE